MTASINASAGSPLPGAGSPRRAGRGRLPEQVEIATYFAVAEMLTNTAKHAHATAVTVDVVLAVGVDAQVRRGRGCDDGRGGAANGGGYG